jgi:hypothetical protein
MSPIRSPGATAALTVESPEGVVREHRRAAAEAAACSWFRTSLPVRDRVRDDFRGEVKAGLATTPTLFAAGGRHTSWFDLAALERLIQEPS